MGASWAKSNSAGQWRSLLLKRCLDRVILNKPSVGLLSAMDAERVDLENYITGKFYEMYHARIHEFLPYLLYLKCGENWSAACGLRFAESAPLFLENYLESPVETYLTDRNGVHPLRQNIVEIGNLVSTRNGASQLLFLILTAVLKSVDAEWIVFTASPQLQENIRGIGFEFEIIADADPNRIENKGSNWGSYYQSHPQVVAGHLDVAYKLMESNVLLKGVLKHFQNVIPDLTATVDLYRTMGSHFHAAVA